MVRSRLNVVGIDSFELFAKINPILKSWIFTFNALNNYINIWPIWPQVKGQPFVLISLSGFTSYLLGLVYFGKNRMMGFVSKSRYIVSVSGIALILESRDSSALFLLYGDIYNKYMYINGQKNQDQKGKVAQTDTKLQCHNFDSYNNVTLLA